MSLSPHFRGASTHVYELARNLIRLGHDVHSVSLGIRVEQKSFEELDGIRVHRVRALAIGLGFLLVVLYRCSNTGRMLIVGFLVFIVLLASYFTPALLGCFGRALTCRC